MENKNYEKATAEVIFFDNDDIITTSGNGGGGGAVSCMTSNGFENAFQ